jgi:NAD(P)H-nitrite reductase large subunit
VEHRGAPGRTPGRIAGLNMAGQVQVYKRKVALNVLRLAGVMLTIIGSVGSGRDDDLVSVARGSSETWLQMPNTIATECGNDVNNIRLMIGEKNLMGGVVMGDQKLSIPLQELVSEQVDITPIRSKLLQSEEKMGEVIMDFWTHQRAKA